MSYIFNQKVQKQKRQELRRLMPPAERLLWGKIRNNQLGVKFRRQHSLEKYIIDFYSPKKKVAIELDGESHYRAGGQEYDEQRSRIIESYKIKLIRFTNKEVYENLEGVVVKINEEIKGLAWPTHPTQPPLTGGEGYI
jgi:very-short-patch-repair endonuclease